MTLLRGRAYLDGKIEDDVSIRVANGRIDEVSAGAATGDRDPLILPGFIDVHVHGGDGADFMDGTVDAVRAVSRFHARHGTTSLAATTLSCSREQILGAINAIVAAAAERSDDMPEIPAIHLEGPYLAPSRSGAQDRGSLRSANLDEMEEWIEAANQLRLIATVAPDCDGVLELIDRFASRILFSIGHTEAGYDRCLESVARGAGHFTHLFNAMPPLHHRSPGPVGAAIDSEQATAELIADGVHVHPVVLASIVRLMPGRITLVTDAMRASGKEDGTWRLQEYDVAVRNGVARLGDGTLAGSLLTMDAAVRNMVNLAKLDLAEVVPLATETPARILGVADRKGRIARGFDADLVVMSAELEVERVFIRGIEIDLD